MKSIIIKFFGKRKKKSYIDFSNLKSILIKPIGDAVGDAIIHTAHIQQLKNAFPSIKIGVLVSKRNTIIFEKNSLVGKIISNSLFSYVRQRGKWDLYLDFQPTITTKSIICDYILSPEFIINFGKDSKKYYTLDNVKNYDVSALVNNEAHIANYLNYSCLASYLSKDDLYYSLPKNISNYINDLNFSTIKVLLNPQGSMREIPPNELNSLLLGIAPRIREKITFLLTNTAGSENYLKQLDDSLNIILVNKMSIDGYFDLVYTVDLVIAVDGGGVHVACAYEKPLLAFYANHQVNIARWRPINRANTYIVISNQITDNNNQTSDFPLEKAMCWLNSELVELIKQKNIV